MGELQKTLFLAEKYPPAIGGSCNMFASRFGLFPPEKVWVLAGAVEGDKAFDGREKYRIHRVPLAWTGPKGFEWLGVAWQMIRGSIPWILKVRPSVIECARPIPEGFAGLVLATLFRRKLVVNFHGEDISVLANYRVERFVLRRIIRKARLNLANSTFTEALIRKVGGQDARTAVVHPGWNPAMLGKPDPDRVEALRRRYGQGPYLVTVGRIQRRKGQDNVIRALPALAASYPGLKYLVVGSSQGGTSGLSGELMTLAKEMAVDSNVVVLGEVPGEELSDYFALADVFVMPNRVEGAGDVEGFGIVFLEAGWMGKPVVGGRSGGVPDAVKDGETGLLVDGTSIESIAEALSKLLSNPALARDMGAKGRDHSATMTSSHVFAKYQAAVAGGRL